MRVATIHAARDIRLEVRDQPKIAGPTEALVRVVASCVCGSDLWNYRGENEITAGAVMGHEVIGVIEEAGAEVRSFSVGDFVVVPFCHCDNTCPNCVNGAQSVCRNLGFTQGGQGEFVVVTQAEGSLVKVPEAPSAAMQSHLLALADVMATGWHAAVSARVAPGSTALVVGDGAVGLCGVLAAREQGAERIIVMSRHTSRQQIAREFGATDVIEERGREAGAALKELTGGVGADAVLECVGTGQAMQTALRCARPGAMVGFVGVPHGVDLPVEMMFGRNVGLSGGMAPVRRYLPGLLDRVLSGRIEPGKVFDVTMPLDEVAEAYAAMDERRAIKVLLRP